MVVSNHLLAVDNWDSPETGEDVFVPGEHHIQITCILVVDKLSKELIFWLKVNLLSNFVDPFAHIKEKTCNACYLKK